MDLLNEIKRNEELVFNDTQFMYSTRARSLRIMAEYEGVKFKLEKLNIEDTIVFFGSARITKENHILSKYYNDAAELSKNLTLWNLKKFKKTKFVVTSGAGPGIMEAANKGSFLAKGTGLGLGITLPFEPHNNIYLKSEENITFHYFFTRKFWFSYLAKVFVIFPGGFGTFDEFFEILTLIQTKKISKKTKIIVYGEKFWKDLINFEKFVEYGVISKEDLDLFEFCDDTKKAFNIITGFLEENY